MPPTHRRKLGAVERLGKKSAPAPQAALKRSSLNVSRAGGHFYEKAKSRSSRERLALDLARDRNGAVALGAPNNVRRKRQRTVLTVATMDKRFEQKGRERMTQLSQALARSSKASNNLKERPRVVAKKSPTGAAAAATRREAAPRPTISNKPRRSVVVAPPPKAKKKKKKESQAAPPPKKKKKESQAAPPLRSSPPPKTNTTTSMAWDRIGQGFRDYLDLLGVTCEMYNREKFDRGSYFNNYTQFQQQQQQADAAVRQPARPVPTPLVPKQPKQEVIDLTDD